MIGDVNKMVVSGTVSKGPQEISKDGQGRGWVNMQVSITEKLSPKAEDVTTLLDVVIFEKNIADYVLQNVAERDRVLIEGRYSRKDGKTKEGKSFTGISLVVTLGHNVLLLHKNYTPDMSPGQMHERQQQNSVPPAYTMQTKPLGGYERNGSNYPYPQDGNPHYPSHPNGARMLQWSLSPYHPQDYNGRHPYPDPRVQGQGRYDPNPSREQHEREFVGDDIRYL